MPIPAGGIVTAGQLARMQPRTTVAAATAPLLAGTTYALIPGCTITVATTTPNASWSAVGVFDCAVTTASTTALMVGRLTVDGTSQAGLAIHSMRQLDRDTVAMLWGEGGTLAAAGNHVFNMEGVINGPSAAGTFNTYSRLLVTITETV
ncbi:hypothetical protein [[Kitasatospora] papulosa]|uniref:hypothetical protein n=1 Tax=[Kitasatospora] papulosa TaxID=1464011 RepID=UPI00368F5B43